MRFAHRAGCVLPVLTPFFLAPSAAAQSDNGEIVVTAQRREERLKDVPIAITALSGEALEASGVDGARQLSQVTPGLYYATQGPFAQPTIRGVGTGVADPGSDANVGLYIDGVYQPSQTANLFDFNNIERVEVLKGPQGTLFGRNATGGAIRITTATPHQDREAKFGISYGRYDEVKSNAFVNLPLGEKVAMNLAGMYQRADGYIENVTLGTKVGDSQVWAVRGKLKFDPTDALSFVVGGNYSDTRDNSTYGLRPVNGNNVTRQSGVIFPSGFYQAALGPVDPEVRVKNKGLNLTATLDLGSGELNSITAYQHFKSNLLVDSDYSPLFLALVDIPIRQETITQEVNFISSLDGPFNFTIGAFYYHDVTNTSLAASGPNGVSARINTHIKTESLSGYAEASYDITDRLTAIVGARYSTERKDAEASFFSNAIVDSGKRWNRLTPRAVLRYALSPEANIYASWSRGFKSGGYNLTSLQRDPVEPEDIDAFEIGYKYADSSISFNTSAFYYDYTNIQVTIQTRQNGTIATLLQNAATAESYGFDAELTASLSSSFRLRGGLAWTHARYKRFEDALLTTPRTDANGVPIGGNLQAPGDASGNHMIRAPEWTGSLTGTYTTQLAGGEFELSATGSYNDGFFWNVANNLPEDAYFVLNARASWTAPNERWQLFAYGENLTSSKYLIYVNNNPIGDNGAPARPWSAGIGVNVFFR